MNALRYLIGLDHDEGREDAYTVIGYDATDPPRNGVKYCNLLDEHGTREFGPYLPDNDMTAEYGEPVPDPAGDGFWRNIRHQLDLARDQGFKFVELDNLDSYTASVALLCFNEAQSRGLKVFVKNPLLVDGDHAALMRHPAACGAIVEPDCGTPEQMQAIRNGLPVFFVSGDYDDPDAVFPNLPLRQENSMTDPAWLAEARASIGKYFDADAPKLAREIAAKYPDMAAYAAQAKTDTPWCGIFVAAMLARAGIRPAYSKDSSDTNDFMWANAPIEAKWGTIVPRSEARPGDVIILPRHTTFFDGNNGSNRFWGIGGNQGNAVTRSSFSWDDVRAVIRPPVTQALPVVSQPSDRFKVCLARVLKHEGGNDDDPRDPGGRTSRGITAARWAEWRQTHPGLPTDVWQAPQAEVEAIYKEKYWDVLWCDQLPPGVDYAVFDFGVNSGPARSAKFLQALVETDQDGEVGPLTVAATLAADPQQLINDFCDDRMTFLQGLGTWGTFGRGWTNRVNDVRRDALADVSLPAAPTIPEPNPVPVPNPPATMEEAFARVEAALADLKESIRVAQQPAQPQIDLTAIVNIVQQLPQIIAAIQQVVTVMQTLGPILSIFGLKLPAITAVPDQPKTSVVNGTTVGAAGAGIGIGGLIVSVINALMQGKVPTQ